MEEEFSKGKNKAAFLRLVVNIEEGKLRILMHARDGEEYRQY
jgi:hypothetical protein